MLCVLAQTWVSEYETHIMSYKYDVFKIVNFAITIYYSQIVKHTHTYLYAAHHRG